MTKTPVKFRKNRYKTVGGVGQQVTYFYRGKDEQKDGWIKGLKVGRMESQKLCPSAFLRKDRVR